MKRHSAPPAVSQPRRRLVLAACGGVALAPLSAYAAYPQQPLKLFVGFPPGGGADLYGRVLANSLGKSLGQSVVVENRAGAGGSIAGGIVANAKPDGYTLLLAMSGNFSAAPAVRDDLPYKVPDDFAPIAKLVDSPYGLVVSGDSPYTSIEDFLQRAKKGKLSFASPGVNGASHLVMEMVKQKAGVEILHVPYKGAAPALNDLFAGLVDSFVNPYTGLMPQIKSGKLRLLATTSAARNPALPDVPTFKEAGVDIDMTLWYGLVAPAGTPNEVISKLTDATREALADPEVLRVYTADGAQSAPIFGADFRSLIVADIEKFRVAVSQGGKG